MNQKLKLDMGSVKESIRIPIKHFVEDSVWFSVGYFVQESVRNFVEKSIADFVYGSIWDSINAYEPKIET
jgi:hypothetical protein